MNMDAPEVGSARGVMGREVARFPLTQMRPDDTTPQRGPLIRHSMPPTFNRLGQGTALLRRRRTAWSFVCAGDASAKLPTRRMVAVEGSLKAGVQATLEPDGQAVTLKCRAHARSGRCCVGDTVSLSLAPAAHARTAHAWICAKPRAAPDAHARWTG